jgi:hypothetical protein
VRPRSSQARVALEHNRRLDERHARHRRGGRGEHGVRGGVGGCCCLRLLRARGRAAAAACLAAACLAAAAAAKQLVHCCLPQPCGELAAVVRMVRAPGVQECKARVLALARAHHALQRSITRSSGGSSSSRMSSASPAQQQGT